MITIKLIANKIKEKIVREMHDKKVKTKQNYSL